MIRVHEGKLLGAENDDGFGSIFDERAIVNFAFVERRLSASLAFAEGLFFQRSADSEAEAGELMLQDVVIDAAFDALVGQLFAECAGDENERDVEAQFSARFKTSMPVQLEDDSRRE